MSKALFRFLRGEINGFYLQNFYNSLNLLSKKLSDFLVKFSQQQFKEGELDSDYLFGLGKFAGIYIPHFQSTESYIALRMTESYVENEEEFSERGLFNKPSELFEFFHLKLDELPHFTFENETPTDVAYFSYPLVTGDINEEATYLMRSSLVGDEEAIGFISENEQDIFDELGRVKEESILSSPPQNLAYTEFYGDNFLLLSEGTDSEAEKINRIRMSEGYLRDGQEKSESGLFVVPLIFLPDINTLSDEENRSSLVGDEELVGYIEEGTSDLFDSEHKVRRDKLLSTLPSGKACSDFYGDNFLFLSENDGSLEDSLLKIRLSESNEVEGYEYSERGLFSLLKQYWQEDINTLSSENLRSSLVGDEEVLGYISSEETEVFDDEGKVRSDKILSSPPQGVAYSEFYGDNFLFLSDDIVSYEKLESSLFMSLFKAIQWVRYNGVSLESLCKVIEIVCPEGLVKISDISSSIDGKHLIVYYTYNEEAQVELKRQRLNMLEFVVSMKFPQLVLSETQTRRR